MNQLQERNSTSLENLWLTRVQSVSMTRAVDLMLDSGASENIVAREGIPPLVGPIEGGTQSVQAQQIATSKRLHPLGRTHF